MADAVHNFHPDYQHYTQHEPSGNYGNKNKNNSNKIKHYLNKDNLKGGSRTHNGDPGGSGAMHGDSGSYAQNEDTRNTSSNSDNNGNNKFFENYERLNYSYQASTIYNNNNNNNGNDTSNNTDNDDANSLSEGFAKISNMASHALNSFKVNVGKSGREVERTTLLSSEEELP